MKSGLQRQYRYYAALPPGKFYLWGGEAFPAKALIQATSMDRASTHLQDIAQMKSRTRKIVKEIFFMNAVGNST